MSFYNFLFSIRIIKSKMIKFSVPISIRRFMFLKLNFWFKLTFSFLFIKKAFLNEFFQLQQKVIHHRFQKRLFWNRIIHIYIYILPEKCKMFCNLRNGLSFLIDVSLIISLSLFICLIFAFNVFFFVLN